MVFDSINLMCPTYKRADTHLPKFKMSAEANARGKVYQTYCVNKADTDTLCYLKQDPLVEIVIENRVQPNLAAFFNMLETQTKHQEDNCLITMVGDDMTFATEGWDLMVLDAMNKARGRGVVYCNDGYIAGERLCVNAFISRPYLRATRRPFMAELFPADIIDVVWHETAAMTGGLHYLPDVLIRHDHFTVNKNKEEWDENAQRLSAVQTVAGTVANHQRAKILAAIAAGNIVEEGMGSWN